MRRLPLIYVFLIVACLSTGGQTMNEELARLREHLNLPASATIRVANAGALPDAVPLKVYLAMGLDMKVRDMFIDRINEWNKGDGKKQGAVEIVSEMEQADVILARYTIQEKVSSETHTVVVPGAVYDPATNTTVTRPVSRTESVSFVPGYSYIIARKPDGFEILYRETGPAALGETRYSGRDLRDGFINMLKARAKNRKK